MNRILKFRAWEKSNNKMYECIVGNTDTKDDKFICPLIWIEENSCWVHSDTCIIMQYTGYKDIKGQEIYEGDILTHKDYWWIKIEYDNGAFIARDIEGIKYNNRITNEYIGNFDISKWKVIGNIYEDKELISQE